MLKPYDDDDDWKASAMTHDSIVVDLLLNLKHTASGPICCDKLVAELALAGWGAKQLRSVSDSKSVSGCSRIGRTRSRRCSPSTPLSWSGGSGGGVDVCDTSSLPLNKSLSFRSKITLPGTKPNCATSSKLRKKKTYAELKVEEVILLRERIRLNQELSMLGAIVKEHIAENETLKRIKLSLIPGQKSSNLMLPDLNMMPFELESAN